MKDDDMRIMSHPYVCPVSFSRTLLNRDETGTVEVEPVAVETEKNDENPGAPVDQEQVIEQEPSQPNDNPFSTCFA